MNVLALVAALAEELAHASTRARVFEISRARLERDVGETELPPDAKKAIDAVIAAALRHAEITERVAQVSRRAHGEARELRGQLAESLVADEVVVASPSMVRLYREELPSIARHDAPVLVRGETGTGKELVAARIHALSRRAGRPFVDVDCAAIPEALVESTLFGHERGAFTGAVERRVGVFERADRGTLFLDEIGELPLAAQAKLLRVVETGRLHRVGGESAIRVDVRIVAATHRDLVEMVAKGTFRADLFYRLGVVFVDLPPLRERPEDLDALTDAFVARTARRFGRPVPAISTSARAALHRHAWPGNVRELRNVVERALASSSGESFEIAFEAGLLAMPRTSEVPSLAASMRDVIERALAASGGRIYGPRGAAKILGLKPTTLQSKMLKLGIRRG